MKAEQIIISPHAVERYIERCDLDATFEEAEEALLRILRWGRPVVRRLSGTELVSAGGDAFLVLVPSGRPGRLTHICVTVITSEMAKESSWLPTEYFHECQKTG